MTIDTFLANAKRAVSNNETVSIGGGEFSPSELRTVISAIKAFCSGSYVLTDSDHAFVQSYCSSFGIYSAETTRKFIADLNVTDWNESLCCELHGSDFSRFVDAYKLWQSALEFNTIR